MADLRQRLYQTKLSLLAVLFVVAGLGLLVLARDTHLPILRVLPIADVGSGLFTTGFIGVALQYLDGRDADERANSRLRKVLAEEAPAIRDAVVDGFAFSPDALQAVTSPEVLQRVVDNSLGMQLQDHELALQAHEQLLEAAMQPSDRLHDSRLTVHLSADERPELLRAIIRREYHFEPTVVALRFACAASTSDYEALLRDPETREVWRTPAHDGLEASDPSAFTVTRVEYDGEPLPLKHSSRKGLQTFSCRLPGPSSAQPHYLTYEYSVLVPRSKHYLYFDFGRATNGLTVEVTADQGVAGLKLLDVLGQPSTVRRSHSRSADGSTTASVASDAWVLPRAAVIAIWQ